MSAWSSQFVRIYMYLFILYWLIHTQSLYTSHPSLLTPLTHHKPSHRHHRCPDNRRNTPALLCHRGSVTMATAIRGRTKIPRAVMRSHDPRNLQRDGIHVYIVQYRTYMYMIVCIHAVEIISFSNCCCLFVCLFTSPGACSGSKCV